MALSETNQDKGKADDGNDSEIDWEYEMGGCIRPLFDEFPPQYPELEEEDEWIDAFAPSPFIEILEDVVAELIGDDVVDEEGDTEDNVYEGENDSDFGVFFWIGMGGTWIPFGDGEVHEMAESDWEGQDEQDGEAGIDVPNNLEDLRSHY